MRNFRLYFYGQLISVAGTWMQTVAEQWLVFQLTHYSPLWLGIISGARAIPYVLFAVPGGHVADRYSRRVVLVWCQTVMMLLAFALAVLASNIWLPAQAWEVALLAALSGLVNAFNMPAQQAFVADMVDRETLGNAIALNSVRFNVARVLGPILAGEVLATTGIAMCFLLNALTFIAVIVSLFMMRLPSMTPQEHETSMWEGFKYIGRTVRVFRMVALVGFCSMFAWSASTLYPAMAHYYHQGARGYSDLIAANGVGAAIAGALVTLIGSSVPRRELVYGGAIVFCAALLVLSRTTVFGLAVAILILSGFAMIVFAISANTAVQEMVPDSLRGRVMAVYSLVFGGLQPLGGLEAGYLAEHSSAPFAIGCNAAVAGAVAVGLYGWSIGEGRAAQRSTRQTPS
ncbi:MAG: MFS transporter [Armatimonadetes bacterium]|nr:MFS transporter [Armatimonadota bacterium]MDE2205705.1 MFS transporter [Armatimonadota bacterium]